MQEISGTRRASRKTRRVPSSDRERDLSRTPAYPFASQLEAWRENARARSSGKSNNALTDGPKPLLRLGPLSDGTARFRASDKGKRHGDRDSSDSSGAGVGAKRESEDSHTNAPSRDHHQEVEWTGRAWNSGSLLVRPGSEAPSGRVPRTTYIYLVGTARSEDKVEVEVIVGAEEERTVMSRATGVTSACVPAREVFTVRNLTKGGNTVVLFWTSPSREFDQKHARRHSRGPREEDGEEEVKRKMPPAAEHRSQVPRESAAPTSTASERFKPDRRCGTE